MRHRHGAAFHAVSHLPSAEILAPEKRLTLAILRDAVACLKKGFAGLILHCYRPARETTEWIQHPGQEWGFSFEVICDALNLDAAAFRQELLETGLSKRLNGRAPKGRSPLLTLRSCAQIGHNLPDHIVRELCLKT